MQNSFPSQLNQTQTPLSSQGAGYFIPGNMPSSFPDPNQMNQGGFFMPGNLPPSQYPYPDPSNSYNQYNQPQDPAMTSSGGFFLPAGLQQSMNGAMPYSDPNQQNSAGYFNPFGGHSGAYPQPQMGLFNQQQSWQQQQFNPYMSSYGNQQGMWGGQSPW